MIYVLTGFVILVVSGLGLCLIQLHRITGKVDAIAARLGEWEKELAEAFGSDQSGEKKYRLAEAIKAMPDVVNDEDFSRD